VGFVIEPRNRHVAGAETVEITAVRFVEGHFAS
jgi:hypothetical protein